MLGALSNKRRDGSPWPKRPTGRMVVFIQGYMQHKNPTRAAREAGYKRPEQESIRLMKHPVVAAEIGRQLKEQESKALKTADDILRYLHTAMFFEPMKYFEAGEDGKWIMPMATLKSLPPEIGCLIEEVEYVDKTRRTKG